MSAALPTKIGQAPTDSPRTYETKKNRLRSLFSSLSVSASPYTSALSSFTREAGGSEAESAERQRGPPGTAETPVKRRTQDSGWLSWISPSRPPAAEVDNAEAGDDRTSWSREGSSTGGLSSHRKDDQAVGTEATAKHCHLLDLPDELLVEIFARLPLSLAQMQTISLVSKRFNTLSQFPLLWSILYSTSFPHDTTLDKALEAVDLPPGRWLGGRYIPAPPPLGPLLGAAQSEGRIAVHFPTLYLSRRQLGQVVRGQDLTYPPRIEEIEAHDSAIYTVELCHPWLFTGSRDRSIKIWRLGSMCGTPGSRCTTQLVGEVKGAHEGSVLSLKFEMNEARDGGTIVSCSSDLTTVVWSVRLGSEVSVEKVGTLGEQTIPALNVALAQNHIITCSHDCGVRIYDRATRRLLHSLQGHTGPVNCLALDPKHRDSHQRFVSASADGSWIIWDMITGEEVRRGVTNPVQGLACIRWEGDRLYAGGNGRTIVVFDATTSQILQIRSGHRDLVRSLSVDPIGETVVSGGYDREARIWEVTTGDMVWTSKNTSLGVVFATAAGRGQVVVAHGSNLRIITFGTELPYRDILM